MGYFPKFLAIEGRDCVGKTTTAQKLSQLLGYEYLEWINSPFKDFRPQLRQSDASPEAQHLFFLATLKDASDRVRKHLAQGKGVVIARYVSSTLVHYPALCKLNRVKPLNIPIELLQLEWPDEQFLLTANLDSLAERIQSRKQEDGVAMDIDEIKQSADKQFYQDVEKSYRSLGLTEINTSNLSPDEVVQQIIRHLA